MGFKQRMPLSPADEISCQAAPEKIFLGFGRILVRPDLFNSVE